MKQAMERWCEKPDTPEVVKAMLRDALNTLKEVDAIADAETDLAEGLRRAARAAASLGSQLDSSAAYIEAAERVRRSASKRDAG